MKHTSHYEQKLARRRHAGTIAFRFPVDHQGQMTLNPTHMTFTEASKETVFFSKELYHPNGTPFMVEGNVRSRPFSRLRRSEEV